MTGVDIFSLARTRGVRVYHMTFESVDGIAVRYHGSPRIAVNARLDERRTRFVVAHELAHIEDETVGPAYCLMAERRANKIARETLVPHDRLREAVEDGHTEYAVLASIFGVGEDVIEERCREMF